MLIFAAKSSIKLLAHRYLHYPINWVVRVMQAGKNQQVGTLCFWVAVSKELRFGKNERGMVVSAKGN